MHFHFKLIPTNNLYMFRTDKLFFFSRQFTVHAICGIYLLLYHIGTETWTLRAAEQKHLASFEMWCCRRMGKISWIDHVRNEEVLLRVNEQRNILHAMRKRKANWIGHILRRNCFLKRVNRREDKGGDRSDKKTRKKT